LPIQFRKQKNITYGIYLLKINNGNTGNFFRHKQRRVLVFLMLRDSFQNCVKGVFGRHKCSKMDTIGPRRGLKGRRDGIT